MDIEQFLEASPAPVTLADETLVDYLAARLRAIEPVVESSTQQASHPHRAVNTSNGLARLSADNEAIIAQLSEVHRMTFARPNRDQ